MSDFDEMSRAIGRIEGKLEEMNKTQTTFGERLEKIDNRLTAHRLKTVGTASLISGGIAAAYHFLKGQ